MPRKYRPHLAGSSSTNDPLTPRHLTKQEFGRRLYNLMLKKGWHQSELARRSGLPRDSISVYVRGKALPSPVNLEALSKALGVEKDTLLPNITESAIDEDFPSFEMKVSPGAPATAWVRVNRLVSMTTAIAIADLLEKDAENKEKQS